MGDDALASPSGRFYRHGWHSWSPTDWRNPASAPRPVTVDAYRLTADDPAHLDDETLGGSWVGALGGPDGETRLLGGLDLDTRVHLVDGAMVGVGPGDWFSATGPERRVFAGYADSLKSRWGARPRDPGPIWCSWYSYYRDIDETLILEVVGDLGDLPFAVVQVDDGWQAGIGEWQPNERFGLGMEVTAERIAATGRVAGLWLAPFLVQESAPVVTEHPEFVLRDAMGAPVRAATNWGGDTFALDTTHPGALEHVTTTIRQARSWGFDFLKLDFLYAAALPGVRAWDMGREAAYRHAVEAVRTAAGDECFLLACGAPIVPSIGVFDALRVGPDVAPYWEDEARVRHLHDRSAPGAADAVATSLNRLWLSDVIAVDPDVVFFRTVRNLLDPTQRRSLIDLARVCGWRATSDPVDWLDAAQRADLEEFLTEKPIVEQVGRYRFLIDGREADFTSIVEGRPR